MSAELAIPHFLDGPEGFVLPPSNKDTRLRAIILGFEDKQADRLPIGERIALLSHQLTLVCETIKIPYLEVFTSLQHIQAWKEEVASNDGAHPRTTGYALLAQLVQEWSFWKSWFM